MAIVSGFFLVWDIWFTEMGVWGFNPEYLSGINFFGLPLGEYLFFITVPFACVFIYECMRYFFPEGLLKPRGAKYVSQLLLLLCVTLSIYAVIKGLWYTGSTFVLLGSFTAYVQYVAKVSWLPRLYESYLPCLVPFFIKNGVLTGSFLVTQVVWYNNAENIGLRLGTIPFEDIFYGLLLVMATVHFYEKFEAIR
tara:strand:+ start:1526 stop:2107 length:582 start_codon:yes stop_codon:yes gene_type:complete